MDADRARRHAGRGLPTRSDPQPNGWVRHDPHPQDRSRRRRAGDVARPAYGPARRAARHHRAARRGALRDASACGSTSARATSRPRCTAARTSSSTCCSRAPPSARRWTSRWRSTPSAVSSTRSPRRSTPASTPGCSTRTCRWPIDVLGDMVTSSTITADDVEAERDVILDEIAMHDDDPDDVVHNLFAQQAYGDSPLGRPIAGTRAVDHVDVAQPDLALLQAALLRAAHRGRGRRQPRPRDAACAGCRRPFARNGFLSDASATPGLGPSGRTRRGVAGTASASRPFEQVNLVLGVNGVPRGDDRRYALGVLNTALGGGTSSRLFQEVREKRGLAYSVFSFASHHADAGLVGVSVGCLPAQARRRAGRRTGRARPGRRRRTDRRGASSAARASCAAASSWASRTPAPGCRASARASWSTTSCSPSTRSSPASTPSPSTTSALLAKELFSQPEILAVVGP